MFISCLNGYFVCKEESPGEIAKFNSFYNQNLASKDDYYTFQPLVSAPDYSVAGLPYLNLTALETFEGKPWQVMLMNTFVYDFSLKALRPIASITNRVEITKGYSYSLSSGLILPGSYYKTFGQVLSYQCQLDFGMLEYRYSEIQYV